MLEMVGFAGMVSKKSSASLASSSSVNLPFDCKEGTLDGSRKPLIEEVGQYRLVKNNLLVFEDTLHASE